MKQCWNKSNRPKQKELLDDSGEESEQDSDDEKQPSREKRRHASSSSVLCSEQDSEDEHQPLGKKRRPASSPEKRSESEQESEEEEKNASSPVEYRDRDEIENSQFSRQARSVFHKEQSQPREEDRRGKVTFSSHFLTADMQHEFLRSLSDVELMRIMNEVYDAVMQPLDMPDPTDGFLDYFDLRKSEDYLTAQYIQSSLMGKYYHGVFYLMTLFTARRLIGNENEKTLDNRSKFDKIYKVLRIGCNMLLTKMSIKKIKEPDNHGADDVHLFDISLPDAENQTAWQKLVLFILSRLFQYGYRRYMGKCYKETSVALCRDPDGNSFYRNADELHANAPLSNFSVDKKYQTHSWSPVCTIEEAVHRLVDKNSDYARWLDLTASPGNAKSTAIYLTHCQDHEFADLTPSRLDRSFLNGILHFGAHKEIFYTFNRQPDLPKSLVCCKHYDQEFDEEFWNINHWFHISTPTFEKILLDQGLISPVRALVYALTGRLFYEVNQEDTWEVIFFIKGVAQSGKSSIGNVAKKFFQTDDVAVMSSNIEQKFGLAPISGKMLFICFEVTKSWSLPRADFQCLISGEELSLAWKHENAKTVKWKVPGLLLGNEIGPWVDSAGSIVRRLLVCEFKKRIVESDPDMHSKLNEELPRLMLKCQQAYMSAIIMFKGHGIWEKVPNYFKEVREKIASNTNPIREFITKSNAVILDADLSMPYFMFDQYFNEYTKQKHYKNLQFSQDEYDDIFGQMGIKIESKTEEWEGTRIHGRFLMGLGLRDKSAIDKPQCGETDMEKSANILQEETAQWKNSIPAADTNTLARSLCDKFAVAQTNYYANVERTLQMVQAQASLLFQKADEDDEDLFTDDEENHQLPQSPVKKTLAEEKKKDEEEEKKVVQKDHSKRRNTGLVDLSNASNDDSGFRESDILM
jgi:phage/plasmid-associated DNA primase